MQIYKVLSISLISIFVLSGCSIIRPNQTSETTPNVIDSDAQVVPATEDADVFEPTTQIEMTMSPFTFSVTEITANPGEVVEVNLTNSQGTHDFVIDELGVQSEIINTGENTAVTFTIPQDATPGTTYEYYCSVMDHRAQGMVGTITVQ